MGCLQVLPAGKALFVSVKIEMLSFMGYVSPMMIRALRVRTLRGSNDEY